MGGRAIFFLIDVILSQIDKNASFFKTGSQPFNLKGKMYEYISFNLLENIYYQNAKSRRYGPRPQLPLNGGGGGGIFFYSMCFYLNFSNLSTFLRLVHNFLIYKGITVLPHFWVEIWPVPGVLTLVFFQ